MIRINLLPLRAKKRKITVRHFFLAYLATVVASTLIIGGIALYQEMQIRNLNSRLAQVKAEVEQYAKYEALLQDVTKKKQLIDKKLEIIRDLQRDRDTIVRLMALISAEVPAEKIWLERLAQSSNSMTLDGVALSNEAVAEFMRNLESSPYVVKGTVNLTHSRQTAMSGKKLREFQITYQFVRFSQLPKSPPKEGS
jgi:type IV pilus assembly protein PilN